MHLCILVRSRLDVDENHSYKKNKQFGGIQRENTLPVKSRRRHSVTAETMVFQQRATRMATPEQKLLSKRNSLSLESLGSINEESQDSISTNKDTTPIGILKLPNINSQGNHVGKRLPVTGEQRCNESDKNSDLLASKRPVYNRKRSNSLAPTMFSKSVQFQEENSVFPVISEEDEENRLSSAIRRRSSSFSDITKIPGGKKSMEKATLQIMMDNSKGLKKFHYLAKLINAELQDIKHSSKKEDTDTEQRETDIVGCRYLRLPKHMRDMNADPKTF